MPDILKAPSAGAAVDNANRGAVADTVSAVIADVRDRGDKAVREYSQRFDQWLSLIHI